MSHDNGFRLNDFVDALATMLSERIWFYVGEGGFYRPAFYTGGHPVKRVKTISVEVVPENPSLLLKKECLVVFYGGYWVKIGLGWRGDMITENNPPSMIYAKLSGPEQRSLELGYPRSKRRKYGTHTMSFGTWPASRDKFGCELRKKLAPFMPDVALFCCSESAAVAPRRVSAELA